MQVRVNDHKDNFYKSKIRFVYQVEYNLPPKENLSIKYLSCLGFLLFFFFGKILSYISVFIIGRK